METPVEPDLAGMMEIVGRRAPRQAPAGVPSPAQSPREITDIECGHRRSQLGEQCEALLPGRLRADPSELGLSDIFKMDQIQLQRLQRSLGPEWPSCGWRPKMAPGE